jgi:serine protease AprX
LRRTLVILIAWVALMAPTSALGQVSVGSVNGAATGVSADEDGIDQYAGLTRGELFVDPVVLDRFEVELSQIVILVVEPETYGAARDALAALGLPYHGFDELHMFSVLLPKDRLGDLPSIPGLLTVYHNEHMELMLDRSADYTAATIVWKTYGVRGKGVTVMVVDSGVDGTHPDVKLGENLIQNVLPLVSAGGGGLLSAQSVENQALTDFDGHGTHVASIIGGLAKAAEVGKYRGIAYESRLVGFAAGREDPSTGETSFESQTVLEAFNYAIANQKKYDIRIVSNSWGANGEFDPKSPINIASLLMYKSGLVVTFAAGNEGEEGEHTLNKYSVAPWVLSVAAGDYLNKLAKFSSRGSDPNERQQAYDHPDLMAPGVAITAAKASTETDGLGTNPYTTKSGTSMATPHVSGIAALMIQGNPKLSPDEVMDILVSTSTPVTGYDVWESGKGYVHALNAYKTALKAPGSLDEFVGGRVKYAGAESGDPKFAKDPVSVGYGSGVASQLASGSQSIDEFTADLVSTAQGWVFLAGLLVLTPLTFRLRRAA